VTDSIRIDRRTTLKWVLAAASTLPLLGPELKAAAATLPPGTTAATGYGRDPLLTRTYRPGELWPLALSAAERRIAAALCDLIIPADAVSPAASAVGVVDFIDEWVSAPYPVHVADRALVTDGLAAIDADARTAFGQEFAALTLARQRELCDPICYLPAAPAGREAAARFFARFRDLTAGGFYTTPAGTKDLGFVGNVALERFEGPPEEVLRQAGLL
jgi:hypothetical protein